MFTELFQIEGPWLGHLAISARPRGGDWLDEEMREWRRVGIDVVMSLLEPEEAADLGLESEKACCEGRGMQFVSFPIADRSIPEFSIQSLLSHVGSELSRGKNAVIHCRQGVGRAGLVATALLVEQGISPTEAIRRVSAARHVQVPETEEQRLWIESFAMAVNPNASN